MVDLTPTSLSAVAVLFFFVCSVFLLVMVARHTQVSDKPVSLFKRLLTGETLTETGLRYRIAVFIALMFTFMNTIGTVVIFLSAQVPAT